MPEDEAKFWEQTYVSGDYREHWEYEVPSQELVAAMATGLAPSDGTALDIGCGAGRESVFLAECSLKTIGVDISPKALEIGTERDQAAATDVDFRRGRFFDLPVADASVNFINDRGALHLVGEDDRPQFAAEVARVLKPGGVMFLRGANEEETKEHFTAISADSVDRHSPSTAFSRGPILPIKPISDSGALRANLVVLRKLKND